MTQSIVVQVGQCGNQIGCRFWDLALREHTLLEDRSDADMSAWNFFRMEENGKDELRARAVMVDTEERVINSIRRTPLGGMLSKHQFVTDVSGSGNNWAVGFHEYGAKYRGKIAEHLRKEAEHCSSLQTFFLLHSLGGGTGSGLGTAVLELLSEEFPKVLRFCAPVIPSTVDDVVTSPYNTVLALEKISSLANISCPAENMALIGICDRVAKAAASFKQTIASSASGMLGQKVTPYDKMNDIVANVLIHMTSSARFPGSFNVDMNDVFTNLVPYPKLQFLVSSITPLHTLFDLNLPARRLDQMFTDSLSPNHQLVECDIKKGTMLSCALLARGDICMADIRRNLDRLRGSLKFVHWNQDGWRTGLCSVAPVRQPHSLLTLCNTSSFQRVLCRLKSGFLKLYNRKAHMHHFLQVSSMEESHFQDALASLTELSTLYQSMEGSDSSEYDNPRIKVLL
ncbi:tubulin epsilon chain-like [Rhipicephalus microplus]|uniref:tubulin epsilon chain-like n=1 Tax=Rhipicephalus microplus TaxID=6941 RepID=UPI003F6CF394